MIYKRKIDLINDCTKHNIKYHYYNHHNNQFRRLIVDLIDDCAYINSCSAQNDAHKVINQLFDEMLEGRKYDQ